MIMDKKSLLSTRKIEIYEKDSKIIKFFRRNPCKACEDILGIKQLDFQKWILQETWNKPLSLWNCCRDAGKTFNGAILLILKAVLYENQGIYIISDTGGQAQELFRKIEEITLNIGKTSASLFGLKDIVKNEIVTSPMNKTGFTHSSIAYHVKFFNGSEIFTLNGDPQHNRSRRATLVFFDEAGICSKELIMIAEAFAAQDSDFKTSIEEGFNIKSLRKNCPTQLVYASSASDVNTMFFTYYKEFSKRMFIGDNRYFCCDIPCDIPLNPTMDGKPWVPLITQSKIDNVMKSNKELALREYYNKFSKDGGDSQPIKWAAIRRNETLLLPELCNKGNDKFVLAFDPARIGHGSIVSVMKIKFDKEIGYYGEISNCTNFVDIASKKGYKMTSQQQVKMLKDAILAYNGNAPDYENILALYLDSGAGGGGVSSYADPLLEDWIDDRGMKHKGMLDNEYELYKDFDKKYPSAIKNKLKLIEPKKYRTIMMDELLELLGLDLIKFTKEYHNSGIVVMPKNNENGEVILYDKSLSMEEEIALLNIDVLKVEMTSIHKVANAEGTTHSFILPKDKGNTNDDRFYTLIMLAHFLYDYRRKNVVNKINEENNIGDFSKFLKKIGLNSDRGQDITSKIFR